MKYYDDLQYIARVDSQDTIIDRVERWEAHTKGLLHRAITVAVYYQDFAILQHRKHPVFDNVFDLTVSSHQLYDKEIESDESTIMRTLERELTIKRSDLEGKPKYEGNVIYQAQDPNSIYQEHEVCHVYTCHTKMVPKMNLDFAYGYSLQKIDEIKNKKSPLYAILAPWVREMIEKNLV